MSRMNLKKMTEWIASDVRENDEEVSRVEDAAQVRLAAFALGQDVALVEAALNLHRTRKQEEELYEKAKAKKPVT